MKLKNKKTGEVREARIVGDHLQLWSTDLEDWIGYDDLDYLAEWWERYEEPKDDAMRAIDSFIHYVEEADDSFCCDESVQKLIEKLKAWKRLKDKGFEFQTTEFECSNLCGNGFEIHFWATMPPQYYNEKEKDKDLDLLFGGEE